jgi:CBS domain containing-hemolysin-like protein
MTSDNPEPPPSEGRFRKLFSRFRTRQPANTDQPFDYTECSNLESSKQEMIRGIIDLSAKNAREIMIPRVDVVAVNADIDLKSLVKAVRNAGHSRIPVYVERIDNIAGILYVKELLQYIIEKPRKFELKKILNKPYFVPETMPLDDLLLEFKRRRLHLACVVDEYGGFGGIVTMEDILEEIVGEIKDEFDEDEPPVLKKIGKNVYEVDSRLSLSDFNDETGADFPKDEFDTIGGYVFDLFGRIPRKNETVKSETASFRIKDIKGTRLIRIVVTLSPE